MTEVNIQKEFDKFKREHQLDYREAYKIFLKLLAGGLVGKAHIQYQSYEASALPLIKAFLKLNNQDPYSDHLGELWMWITGTYGKPTDGQFFTPSDICKMISKIMNPRVDTTLYRTPETAFRLQEPCCGSGAMVLPILKELATRDSKMYFMLHLNDLDEVCCMATFIQITFALLHLDITDRTKLYVTRGNILCYPNGEELKYALGSSNEEIIEWELRIMNDIHSIKEARTKSSKIPKKSNQD